MKRYAIFIALVCAMLIMLCGSVSAADAPSASFMANTTEGNAPLSVQYTDTSTGNPTSWNWDFGDEQTSNEQNPVHTYTTAGNFNVSLTTSNNVGVSTLKKSEYITVKKLSNELVNTGIKGAQNGLKSVPASQSTNTGVNVNSVAPPVAKFSADKTACLVPLRVTFTDESTGEVTSYAWDFDNDGTIDSTDKNPVWIYTKPGLYTVTEKVSGPGGSNSLTIPDYIMVPDSTAPVPKADLPNGIYNSNKTVKLTATDDKDTNPTIYYTVDGTTPTRNSLDPTKKSILYKGPITISKEGTTILKFIAVDSTGNVSGVQTRIYKIDKTRPTASTNIKSGRYNTTKTVTIKMSEAGVIYYTTNGTTPTNKSTRYTKPLKISKTTILKYLTIDMAGNKSPTYIHNYVIDKTAPKIVNTNPRNKATKISLNTPITIKFSEKISKGTSYSKIYIKNLTTGKIVQATKTISGNTLTIKSTHTKTNRNNYAVYIPVGALKDIAGNKNIKYVLTFKTK